MLIGLETQPGTGDFADQRQARSLKVRRGRFEARSGSIAADCAGGRTGPVRRRSRPPWPERYWQCCLMYRHPRACAPAAATCCAPRRCRCQWSGKAPIARCHTRPAPLRHPPPVGAGCGCWPRPCRSTGAAAHRRQNLANRPRTPAWRHNTHRPCWPAIAGRSAPPVSRRSAPASSH